MAGWQLRDAVEARLARGPLQPELSRELSARFRRFEQNWLHAEGIPGRPWFKHLLYAARYTYANLELPGLTEAAEAGDWERAGEQRALLEAAIESNTALLRETRDRVAGTGPTGS